MNDNNKYPYPTTNRHDDLKLSLISELIFCKLKDYLTLGKSISFKKVNELEDFTTFRSQILITDECKIRMDESNQWMFSIEGVARGIAHGLDSFIIKDLVTNADYIDAPIEWNRDSVDIFEDLKNTGIVTGNTTIYYPIKLFSVLHSPSYLDLTKEIELDGDCSRCLTFIGTPALNAIDAIIVMKANPYIKIEYIILTDGPSRDPIDGRDIYTIRTDYKSTIDYSKVSIIKNVYKE